MTETQMNILKFLDGVTCWYKDDAQSVFNKPDQAGTYHSPNSDLRAN